MLRRGCRTGKYCYRDRLEALFFLLRIQEADDPRHQERWAYECPVCGHWHLTSEERRSAGPEQEGASRRKNERGRSKFNRRARNRKRFKYEKGGDRHEIEVSQG